MKSKLYIFILGIFFGIIFSNLFPLFIFAIYVPVMILSMLLLGIAILLWRIKL
jgi:hypothetical protein